MTDLCAQHAVELPLRRLAGFECAGGVGGCLLAAGGVWAMGPGAVQVGLAGVLSILMGIACGLCVFWLAGPRAVFTIASVQIGASTVRMVVGLGVAAWLLLASRRGGGEGMDPLMLLGVFMMGQAAALIAELGVILPILRANDGSKRTMGGALPDTEQAG